MNIGIDLSPLQSNHRMRGVGAVVINLINNLSDYDKKHHSFIFFMDANDESKKTALDLINLTGINYEVRTKPTNKHRELKLPGKLRILSRLIKKLSTMIRFYVGEKGYDDNGLDVFLLTDQICSMPDLKRSIKKVMVAYDLIPYIVEWDYLRRYSTIRNAGLSRKAALASQLQRSVYISKLRINSKKSDKIFAISDQSRKDFIKYAKVSGDKISTLYLGVNLPSLHSLENTPKIKYVNSSWGYMPREFKFDISTPFILFVGGTDARRKLDDLVTAFNHLRGQGYQLNLVLSGDILQGPNNLPVQSSREALLRSSYKEDIIYLGYTDDAVRNWLYKNALAFIYPSRYEGFGLPVLEAMSYGTPVITYNNTSIVEIAGNSALYASDSMSIKDNVEKMINDANIRKRYSQLGLKQASKYTWKTTTEKLMKELSEP